MHLVHTFKSVNRSVYAALKIKMGSTTETLACEPIALIGMSCKFPGDASTPEKFWNMLAEGRDAWSEIPLSRFNLRGVYHPNKEKLSTASSSKTND